MLYCVYELDNDEMKRFKNWSDMNHLMIMQQLFLD
jgi:hypothetical protein